MSGSASKKIKTITTEDIEGSFLPQDREAVAIHARSLAALERTRGLGDDAIRNDDAIHE